MYSTSPSMRILHWFLMYSHSLARWHAQIILALSCNVLSPSPLTHLANLRRRIRSKPHRSCTPQVSAIFPLKRPSKLTALKTLLAPTIRAPRKHIVVRGPDVVVVAARLELLHVLRDRASNASLARNIVACSTDLIAALLRHFLTGRIYTGDADRVPAFAGEVGAGADRVRRRSTAMGEVKGWGALLARFRVAVAECWGGCGGSC